MKNYSISIASASALAVAFLIAWQQPVLARHDRIRVPDNIQVPPGSKAFLEGRAIGTQNYMCLPSGAAFAWTAVGPQATLFNEKGGQIITHYLSPNPDEAGLARATWQHSRDTSSVWALSIASSSDPAYVAPGAIPWLLLRIVGDEEGPTGGRIMTRASYVHRVNTVGGVAPTTGCGGAADVGKRVFVPYEADYIFYRDRRAEDDN